MTPVIGQVLTAAWGRYAVHRVDGDQVVLRDVARPGAFVLPARAEFEANYRPVIAAVEPTPIELVHAPQQLAQRDAGQDCGRPRDRRPAAPPAAPAVVPAGRQVCAGCELPRIALAYIGEVGYCWRCYGVSEAPRPVATSSASGWRPTPGEAVYESRSEVGSFERPDAAAARPKPARSAPARVDAQEWLGSTGEVRR